MTNHQSRRWNLPISEFKSLSTFINKMPSWSIYQSVEIVIVVLLFCSKMTCSLDHNYALYLSPQWNSKCLLAIAALALFLLRSTHFGEKNPPSFLNPLIQYTYPYDKLTLPPGIYSRYVLCT